MAKCWLSSSGTHQLCCWWTAWNMDTQLTPTYPFMLKNLQLARRKHPSLSDGVVLYYDNTQLHMAQWTWNLLHIYAEKYWTIPCTVWIWHPAVSICFLPWRHTCQFVISLWWRCQTCYKQSCGWHIQDGQTTSCDHLRGLCLKVAY